MSRIRSRSARIVVGLVGAVVAVGGVSAASASSAEAASTTATRARVVQWVDGDTVRTSVGPVRLIGMDTPERGEDCSRQATINAGRLAPIGTRITLVRVLGRDNTDRYGRKLRYVQAAGVDVGLRQIVNGLADARYDSGSYGSHPRRATYRHADATHSDRDCAPASPPATPDNGCDPNYTGCVPIDSDVDCAGGSGNGPSYVDGPVRIIGTDIYGLDSDGDGVGCG
jgi:endonuclease YncB( thermonuclease family)